MAPVRHLLYLGILVSICYLWSPNKNNLQYAYMDEIGQVQGAPSAAGSAASDAPLPAAGVGWSHHECERGWLTRVLACCEQEEEEEEEA